MIHLNNISKSFTNKQTKKVLSNVSFKFSSGAVHSLHGPNGSGKTTLFKIIAGLIIPDTGQIKFANKNENICYVGNNSRSFINRISALENLNYFYSTRIGKKLNFNKKLSELSETLEIKQILDRDVSTFSSGEMQKLAILRAISYEPNILILDETISSIDEASQERVMSYLATELDKKRLTNIFLSSHNHQFLNKYSNSIFNLENEINV